MEAFKDHIRDALLDTITHIFKCSHPNVNFLKIEGLVAITADADVFIVHVDKLFGLNCKDERIEEVEELPNQENIKSMAQPQNDLQLNNSSNWPVHTLLEHYRSVKKEVISPTSVFIEGNTERNGRVEQQSESFYEEESWNASESCSLEDEQDPNYGGFPMPVYRCRAKESPRQRHLGKERCRRTPQKPRRRLPEKVGRSEDYIITESSHVCAYPNCFKRFKLRRDLLRHQTNKHGRIPVRKRRRAAYDEEEEEEYEEDEFRYGGFDPPNQE